MPRIQQCALPGDSLLAKYSRNGAFTDCYSTEVPVAVSHEQYVEAFYSGSLFRIERLLLSWFASRPSTDGEVKALAQGSTADFAAWRVEGRSSTELLLCDFTGRTRSWLMVVPLNLKSSAATRLYFGSAVVPGATSGHMGFVFTALLSFHKLYSRALLSAARSRLLRTGSSSRG